MAGWQSDSKFRGLNSAELFSSRLRWTPQTLNKWLGDPEDLVNGRRMGFLIESEQERADLIAYLATLK